MVVAEASRTDVSLSKIEEKMLYFSETDWTLPDIWEVNDAFEKQYNQAEYEEKIAGIIRSFRSKARKTKELESWNDAVGVLRRGDHYLLVMVDIAAGRISVGGIESEADSGKRFLKLVGIAVAIFLVCVVLFLFFLFLTR